MNDKIPVSIVDEDLYLKPPTLLLGTVDKFARMLHQQESWSFMGLNKIPVGDHNVDVLPPTLVVQDELHLIDGPLGTIAGMYEAAFDTIIKQKGVNIKYIELLQQYYVLKSKYRLFMGGLVEYFHQVVCPLMIHFLVRRILIRMAEHFWEL